MFLTLIYPSSGACDYSLELPHWSYCSWFDVCWSFSVFALEWYSRCQLKQLKNCASACNMDTTPTQPHWNSNTHWTKNNTTNVVIQQNSHKLLMMDILMSETCWTHKKWNKIASDIKLVFYSSTMNFHPFHCHVQNVTIPCRSQELLPFLSVMYFFLPPFSTNYSSILSHLILPSIYWSSSQSCCFQIHI